MAIRWAASKPTMLNWSEPRPIMCGHPLSMTRITAPEPLIASRWLDGLPPWASNLPEALLIL
jgi:hypothetical protein